MRWALAAIALMLHATDAEAHALDPARLDLRATGDGRYLVSFKVGRGGEAEGDGRLEPIFPAHCKRTSAVRTEQGPRAMTTSFELDCNLVGYAIEFVGLAHSKTDVLVDVALADGRNVMSVVRAADPVFRIERERTVREALAGALGEGVRATARSPIVLVLLLALLLATPRVSGRAAVFALAGGLTLAAIMAGAILVPSAIRGALGALLLLAMAMLLSRSQASGSSARSPRAVAAIVGLSAVALAGPHVGTDPDHIVVSVIGASIAAACVWGVLGVISGLALGNKTARYALGSATIFFALRALS